MSPTLKLKPDGEDNDSAILHRVDRDLAAARVLHRWWEERGVEGHFAKQVKLSQSLNRPDSAWAFFDVAKLPGGDYPVMGVVQDMFYDRPKLTVEGPDLERTRLQLREFVLRYFMRVSDFRDPDTHVEQDPSQPPPRFRSNPLSWCADPGPRVRGFGFSQHFFQTKAGEIGKIPEDQRFAILDLRTVASNLEWLIAKVQLYDFSVKLRLAESTVWQLLLTLDEASWLALAPEFLCDRENPQAGVRAEYGIGYAYLRNPVPSQLAYGPGEFDAAFKIIRFRLLERGEIHVRMVFMSNRANGVMRVRLDPLRLMIRCANWASCGIASDLASRIERALQTRDIPAFDPVFAYVDVANALSGGRAERDWCVSRDQLDWDFMLQHFNVHYRALTGSLMTWRQIADWTNEAGVPEWARTGLSA